MKVPFKRGSMAFEDYNYGHYNKYILKDPEHVDSDDEEATIKRLQMRKLKSLQGMNIDDSDGEYLPLK